MTVTNLATDPSYTIYNIKTDAYRHLTGTTADEVLVNKNILPQNV
jgi:hypothetical protein